MNTDLVGNSHTLDASELEIPGFKTWRGRPIAELGRSELLEMIFFLACHYQETMSPEAIRQRARGRARAN